MLGSHLRIVCPDEHLLTVATRVNKEDPNAESLQDRYMTLDFADLQVNTKRSDNWYCLLRNVQGATSLLSILDGSFVHQIDNTKFEEDKVFCEWLYYLDWDQEELQVGGRFVDGVVKFRELNEDWMTKLEDTEIGAF